MELWKMFDPNTFGSVYVGYWFIIVISQKNSIQNIFLQQKLLELEFNYGEPSEQHFVIHRV